MVLIKMKLEREIEINRLQQSEILGVFGYEGSLWALWFFFFLDGWALWFCLSAEQNFKF